jgi:hypothetical protein
MGRLRMPSRGTGFVLALPFLVSAGGFPESSFTLGAGFLSLSPSSPAGSASEPGFVGYFGRAEYLRRLGIPLGITLGLGYDFCPVCGDGSSGSHIGSVSAVGQIIPWKYPVQILAGAGFAGGEVKGVGEFGEFHLPVIVRLLARSEEAERFVSAGVEIHYGWTRRNQVVSVSVPVQWARR